jgi:SOS-response transcriptional repressor LexA
MVEVAEFFERVDQLRDAKGIESDRALSIAVNGKPDLIRDAKRKQRLPKGDNLASLAEALGTTVDWLMHGSPSEVASEVAFADASLRWQGFPGGRRNETLPVLGTAHGGTVIHPDVDGAEADVEQTLFEPTQVVRYIIRPPALTGVQEAYAVYVQGDSMDPRYRPGDMAVVDPRKPPQIGDDVIVQMSSNGDDEISCILIKTLARRSATFVELIQYNPPLRFRVDVRRVRRLHRIMTQSDMLGG